MSRTNNRLSIVIPAYNEERGIVDVIKKLPSDCEIIVVDNRSSDNTAELAKKAGATVISEKHQGYGYALKAGIKNATGEYVITLDADGQYPGHLVNGILEQMLNNNLDFVSCSRFPLKTKATLSPTRILGNWYLTTLANLLFRITLADSQSGMFIFKKSNYSSIEPVSNDMPYSQEIKIKAFRNINFKCKEVWIPYFDRIGDSKLFPLRHGLMNTLSLFWLRLNLAR